jgi:hypothetical protein
MSVRTVYPEGRPKQVRPNLGRRLLGKKLAGRLRSFKALNADVAFSVGDPC